MSWAEFKFLNKNICITNQISFCEFEPYKWNWCPTYPISILCMRLFSIVWQKTFRKGPQKKLVNNNIGVVCVCPSSRKSSSFTWQANDGMGGGQNSLSGLHVHASTNQVFLPGTNVKRLEYRHLFLKLMTNLNDYYLYE